MSVARTIPTSQSTDLSTCTIKIEGQALPAEIQVLGVAIIKEVNKIPVVRLKISDGDPATSDFTISNGENFIPGKEVEIMMGYHGDETSVFKGIITQHSNNISEKKSELAIECRDKVVMMTIAKKSKHYNSVTDSDVAEEIIGSYGLDADVESSSITHEELIQFDITDWDFMVSQMDIIGKICLVNDGKVSFKKPDLNSDPVLDVLFGATILEYNANIDSRNQLKSVSAKSWDFSQQAVNEVTAEEPSAQEAGNISATDLSDVLSSDYKLVHSGNLGNEQLQAWADAKLMKQRLSKVSGAVKFQGYPQLLPGSFIRLNGVGDRFNGPVFVNSVKHELAKGDWSTEATFGMKPDWYSQSKFPGLAEAENGRIPSGMKGLIIGIVTDIQDPAGENRVQVRIPTISENEDGVWARVATLDAGNNRGSFFRPEIGDEVVIGFIQDDVSYPVILGMLNSSAKPAAITVSSSNAEKGYVSREQLKMIFNDDEKSLKIETPAGKKITISEQDALIKIEDENGNKITMDSSGITIEAAATLTLKGGSEVKIDAASVTVNGSGTTTIKGGVVQIN